MKSSLTRTIRAIRAAGLSVTAVEVAPDGAFTVRTTAEAVADFEEGLAQMRAVRAQRKAARDPRTVSQKVQDAQQSALQAWDQIKQAEREARVKPAPPGLPPGPSDRLLLGIGEVARMMGVSKTTVWRRVSTGEIATRKLGTRTLIHRDEINRFLGAL